MPTKEQIRQKVKSEVANEANIDIDLIEDGHVLSAPPLNLDKVSLGMLTLTLRKYIKTYSSNTILVKDVRKSGLTVEGLIELVNKKLK